MANVINAPRLLSNPLFHLQRHPTGTSRASPLIKRGDLWTSAGILKLARFYAMLRLCVLSTSNSKLLSGLTDFWHATFGYRKVRTKCARQTMNFFGNSSPYLGLSSGKNLSRSMLLITRRSQRQLFIESKSVIHSGSAPVQAQPRNKLNFGFFEENVAYQAFMSASGRWRHCRSCSIHLSGLFRWRSGRIGLDAGTVTASRSTLQRLMLPYKLCWGALLKSNGRLGR